MKGIAGGDSFTLVTFGKQAMRPRILFARTLPKGYLPNDASGNQRSSPGTTGPNSGRVEIRLSRRPLRTDIPESTRGGRHHPLRSVHRPQRKTAQPPRCSRNTHCYRLRQAPEEELPCPAFEASDSFRNRAKNLKAACQRIEEQYGGEVPRSMEALIELPGVGRKDRKRGSGKRLWIGGWDCRRHPCPPSSRRLGITAETDPVKVERSLVTFVPKGNGLSSAIG